MPIEMVIRADTMLDFAFEVHKLAEVFIPQMLKGERPDDAPEETPRPGRRAKKLRDTAGAVDTGAHSGSPDGDPSVDPAPSQRGEAEVVGRVGGEPDRLQSAPAAEDHLEGDAVADAETHSVGIRPSAPLPTLAGIEQLARRVAAQKSFTVLKSIFDKHGVKRFPDLPEEAYAAAYGDLEAALAA